MTWLVTLWLAAAPDAGIKARPLRFDVPGVIEATVVDERLEAAGYPVTVRAVKSTAKPDVLVRFFYDAFERAGLYPLPEEHTPKPLRALSITGLDTRSLISYTVIFQASPDDTTTAIITETYMNERRAKAPAADATPLFPGASEVVRSSSEGVQTVSYLAPAAPDEVDRFYRDVLVKAGFQAGTIGRFTRGGELLEVHAIPGASTKSARVTLIQRAGTE